MGNPVSKIGHEIQAEELTEGSLPSTPILTPKTRIADLDPRSPSTNIVRTPIEVLLTPNRREHLDTSTDSLNDKIERDSLHTPHALKTLLTDPRSPTTDFARTPIIITDAISTKPPLLKLHNKNLDKARKTFQTCTPSNINSAKENVKVVPFKLLESSPIIAKPPTDNKRKSFVGLLETNLDFVETDLDSVIQNKSLSQQISDKSHVECDNLKEAVDITESEDDVLKKIEDVCVNDAKEHSLSSEDATIYDFKAIKIETDVEVDDDGLKIKKILNSANVKTEAKELAVATANVKDFDKKLSNLIYEDQDNNVTVKSVSVTEGNRTALGTRNANTNSNPRLIPKLKVSDKPRKLEKESSKIPIFKDKRIRAKHNQQCENMPPKNLDEFSNNGRTKQHWDPNSTLII